jgi:F-type H+-transporting ATPase subunit b
MRSQLPRVMPARILLGPGMLACATWPAHAAGTMPQFDFSNPLLKAQVIWGAVIFVVMYAAFAWVGLPRVAGVLDSRAQTINADLEQAQRAKDEADRALAELNEARRRALTEAQAGIAEAAERAKQAAAEVSAELNAKLEAQLAESEARIGALRASAQAALRRAATDTADDLITRVVGRPPEPELVGNAVGEALAERGLSGA